MNPVQFKVTSNQEKQMQVKGMTVFNTDHFDSKKQPMFFGKPLGIQRYDSYKHNTTKQTKIHTNTTLQDKLRYTQTQHYKTIS